MSMALVVALLLLGLCAGGSGGKIPLHFFYMTTKTGFFRASGAIPVVDLALEQINNRTDILPNYSLTYTSILDSQCNARASLDAFYEHFRGDFNLTYLSLLCCGCSTATIPIAEISHYWNIPQMAGVEGSPELNDRQRFQGFFRTDASGEYTGEGLAEVAREFNWTQMAVITRGVSFYQSVVDSLDSIFRSENRRLETSVVLDNNGNFPYNLFHRLVERDYRIIFINADQNVGYAALCEAYHLGWFAPRYVWITHGWYNRNWWEEDYGNSSCTPEMLKRMLNGSLIVNPNNNLVSDEKDVVTFSGLTPEEYERAYSQRLQEERYQELNLTHFIIAGSEFDAMWAMALGLHAASERISTNDSSGCEDVPGELVPLERFNYLNDKMGCVLNNSFQQVNFRGITGPVVFNDVGSRDSNIIRVQQYHLLSGSRTDRRDTVADVVVSLNHNSSEIIFKDNLGVTSLWPGGVPYDGAVQERIHPNSIVLVSIYSVAAFAGIVYAIACLLFNIIFRNRKVVKLSSPNLNYLVVAGAIILYASVYLYIFSERANLHDALCNLQQWTFSLGYNLCFAVILAKTWRIYHIFSNPAPKKKVPKDWHLFVIVALVVAGDLFIVFIGTTIPSSRLKATRVPDRQHPKSQENDINYDNYVFACKNNDSIVWLAMSYAYKGLLQLVAMFMAFHTRRVKIKALNDSKQIAFTIYINSIILALLAVVEFALSDYHEVHAALFGLALLIGSTVFLTLLFIPKMVHLCNDPKGEKVMEPSTTMASAITMKPAKDVPAHTTEITGLKQQIAELEKTLADQVGNHKKDHSEDANDEGHNV